MGRTLTLGIAVSGAAIVLALGSGARAQSGGEADIREERAAAFRLLDALNECIQERFRNLTTGLFGGARLLPATPHRNRPAQFEAENVREEVAVRELEVARLRVLTYVVSRKILGEPLYHVETLNGVSTATNLLYVVPGVRFEVDGVAVQTVQPSAVPVPVTVPVPIKGPIGVTPSQGPIPLAGAPTPNALEEESRAALLAFDDAESTEFSIGEWSFVARPVRASTAACLGCHSLAAGDENLLRIGDPLGAVLYGYRRAP